MDNIDEMIAWENGELDEEQTAALFQKLIDSGIVWDLQGCYGRQAMALLQSGSCHR